MRVTAWMVTLVVSLVAGAGRVASAQAPSDDAKLTQDALVELRRELARKLRTPEVASPLIEQRLAKKKEKLEAEQRELFLLELAVRLSAKGSPIDLDHLVFVPSLDLVEKRLRGQVSTKRVIDDDDRQDLWQRAKNVADKLHGGGDPLKIDPLLRASAAVALVTHSSALSPGPSGELGLATSRYRVMGFKPCPGDPFESQPVGGYCSSFWVGADLMVTAGHCLVDARGRRVDPREVSFVFGFAATAEGVVNQTFRPDQVYRGVELVALSVDGDRDHAVVRVHQAISMPGVSPLRPRDQAASVGEPVGLIGYPSGLPLKIAFKDAFSASGGPPPAVRRVVDDAFEVSVDSFGGNSGAPILTGDDPYEVLGILISGEPDYGLLATDTSACFVPLKSDSSDPDIKWERAASIAQVRKLIP
ncbi:serine protease [Myxococcota bacterium]|nr:serine protease [Myxococcota bacterium]